MIDFGTVKPGSTIRIPFSSFDKDDGSSITMTNYAAADILAYKDGGTTERASTAGYTATTDFDGKTGKHLAIIDLADNTTAGFWNSGSEYVIAIDAVTVDAVTTGGWIARFRIGYPGAVLDTTIASLSTQTSFTLTAGPAEDDALNGMWAVIHDIASAVQMSWVQIDDYTGSSKTVTLSAGATFTAATGDNISILFPAPLQPTVTARKLDVSTGGEAGVDWANVGSQSTTVSLTNTTVATATNVTTVNGLASGVITATAIAADAIGASELAADAVTEIRSLASGASDSGTTTTMVDAARTEADTDYWKGSIIVFTSGNIAGQARLITGFNASTDTITYAPATTQAAATQTYEIWPNSAVDVQQWLQTTVSTPTVAGVPNVNVKTWNDLTTVALPLVPTTAGRTLDVSATGEAGLDWANIGSPTTTVDLTGTTIAVTQKVDVDTIKTNPVVNAGTITFPTGATLASTTNITAGTIATVTNVTTVNGLAAGVITAAAIADAAIDRATFAVDTGLQSIRSNTAQAGASTSITLDASASSTTDFFKGSLIYLTGGTGVGQYRLCTAYNGTTKVATVTPAWATNPSSDSTFAVMPQGMVSAEALLGTVFVTPATAGIVDVNVKNINNAAVSTSSAQIGVNVVNAAGTAWASGAITSSVLAADCIGASQIATNAIGSDELAASAITEIQSGLSTVTTAQVNAEVDAALADIRLDELLSADSDIDGAAPPTVGSVFHELMTKAAGSFTYDQTTDSIEAIRDRGDAAWTTATGFSTHSAADVWAVGTRTLTAGTNIQLPSNGLANVTAWTVDITGSLSGAVGSIASGGITSASFASGAITAAAIAADAIGASELAADALTEIRSLASGTSDSGSTTTMVDSARTESDTDYWKGSFIVFTSGNISGQARLITGFNASTDTITFAPATTQAVSTQTYEIWPAAPVDVQQWLQTTVSTPTVAGVPNINVKTWNDLTTVALPLVPTTAGRTLDVSATGEAGIDWANIGSPTTTVALTDTTIAVTQKVDVDTIKTNAVVNGGTITFPTNATLASTTNITAGTIATVTNLTNAPTNGDLTATMKTSVAVAVWDAARSSYVASGSFGRVLQAVRDNTAQAGASTTITLDASASSTDDFYNFGLIKIISGTGVGQSKFITDYVGSTKIATVDSAWVTNPDNTSVFVIDFFAQIPGASAPTAAQVATAVWQDTTSSDFTTNGSVGQLVFNYNQYVRRNTAQAGASTTITLDASASATDDIYNYELIEIISGTGVGQSKFITDYVGSTKVATVDSAWAVNPDSSSVFLIKFFAQIPGASAPTAAQVATAVWQDATAGDFTTSGSIGKSLFTSGVVPGGSGGLMISGTNSGTTTLGALTVSGATTLTGAVAASNASNNITGIDVAKISGDATAADNAEAFFDGTGYAGTGNTIPTVTSITNAVTISAGTGTGQLDFTSGVVKANVTQFNGTNGTFASGRPEVNTSHIAGSAVSTSTAQIGVNVVNAGGTAWASGSLTSGVLAADAATEIRSLASGTSDSGTTTTMVDAARTETDTDYWKGSFIVFTSGNISGQARLITGFNTSTDTITFAPATTQAVSTQTYEIWPAAPVDVQQWLQTTVSTPTVAGVPNVNTKTWNDLTTVALPLIPTVAGRTLDVSTTGEAGIDWANVGSPTTTLSLTNTTIGSINGITFPTNFSAMSITAGGLVDITQAAADKAWSTTTRVLTAGTNIALAKGTGVTGFNDLSAAQVNSEVDTALADVRLDELLAADSDIDGAAPPTVGSVFHELMSKTAGSFTFDQTTDSVEAIRDRGDAAWTTATGYSTHTAADVWTSGTRTLTAGTNIQLPSNGLANISAWTVNITGNLSGSVGSLTTNNDKTGYSLTQTFPTNFSSLSITAGGLTDITQAAADKAWGTATRVLTAGTNIGFPTAVQVRQEMDSNSTQLAAITGLTNNIQITAGRVVADATAIGGSATAATNQANAATAIYSGSVTGASSTTTIVDSGLTQTATGHWNGRVVIITSGTLKYQAAVISNFTPGTDTLTLATFTSAPQIGDTFVIL